jgi:probable rRNA maturation factor
MVEINNKTKSRIDLALIKRITEQFLEKYKLKNKTVSVALVTDSVIRKLNRIYLRQDRVTDVLAFPGEDGYLGEIIIGYPQIKRQVKKFSGSIRKELSVVLAHGLIHLLGYEDKTAKGREEMEELGNKFLKAIL